MNLFRAFARENIQLTTVINLSKLQAFMLHQNNFSINNIRISHCDVEKLKNLFFERLKKEKDRVPQKTSLHNKPKQKRSHALHELIRKIYKDIRDKSARAIWDKLLNQVDDKGILQSVDQWTGRGAKICWISYEGNEQSMIRKTFQTHISSLRRPENK